MKNSMISEYIMTVDAIRQGLVKFDEVAVLSAGFSPRVFVANLTFKKNLTIRYFNEYYSEIINKQEQPPYKSEPLKTPSKRDSFFWWVRNYSGKIFFEIAAFDFGRYIDKSYTAHALNEMSLLSAMLHRDGVAQAKIPDWLQEKSKEGFIDPFSGKAYQWDAQEKSVKLILNEHFKLNKPIITVPFGDGIM